MTRKRGTGLLACQGVLSRLLVFCLLAAVPLAAQPFEFWPGAAYDPRIPTFAQVLGYEPGERITTHAGILRYFDALAAASPRIRVFEYGTSWEGRKLIYAAIASEPNIKQLGSIRAAIERFADPRKTSEAESRELAAGLPAVVWLGYGVHGDEISSPDAALVSAYHLLAARGSSMVDAILANTVVLIDPLQNPDGRERFINYYEQTRGLEPDADPLAAEHNQPWPGGRYNHYLFDLNRDWIALTQPEIEAQVKVLRQWLPVVVVDLHEMNGDASYFFSPEADPYNPNLTAAQRENLNLFGKNNARWFDRYGFDYFTREQYDAFYPGYGASWPEYYGALAMTYEQGSARGLLRRRADGSLLSFRDTVRHHFVASLATLETAAGHRGKLLSDFYEYRASATREGANEPVKAYILPPGHDPSATGKLARILAEHGVELQRAAAAFHAREVGQAPSPAKEFPAGSYVVPLAQPAKRLIRTLLDANTAMDDSFLAAEEARRKRRERSEIYDVTAWSLPLMFNVEALAAPEITGGSLVPANVDSVNGSGVVRGAAAKVAYLVPWGGQAAARLLAAALRQNLSAHTSDRAFTQDGRTYPAGTVIFKVNSNPSDLGQKLAALARSTGAEVYASDTGWVEDGVNFGSRYVLPVRKPAIAMLWDAPSSSSAAGAARFVIERQYGYPVTPIRSLQMAAADLARFNVLILPPGEGYAEWLSDKGIERLKNWVAAGGTLIGLGQAVGFLADPDVGLLDIAQETSVGPADKKKNEDQPEKPKRVPGTEITSPEQFEQATRAAAELPDTAPGAILRARIRADHWLTAGAPESVNAMITGRSIYTPIKADRGVNAAYFESADKLVASGYLWSENRRQMAYKPLVVVELSGAGVVVGFTADPNFRGMLDGMNLLFLNAIFRGPSHTRTAASEE
jgi:hypothetical protein